MMQSMNCLESNHADLARTNHNWNRTVHTLLCSRLFPIQGGEIMSLHKTKPKRLMSSKLRRLLVEGFDKSYYERKTGKVYVGCSYCAPTIIQGRACHERGCYNTTHREE